MDTKRNIFQEFLGFWKKNICLCTFCCFFILASAVLLGFYFIFNQTASKNAAESQISNNGFVFPRDEGEHSDLKTESWYLVSHLFETDHPENKFDVLIFYVKDGSIIIKFTDIKNDKVFSRTINTGRSDIDRKSVV
jgi:hypothetical protein